MKKYSTLVLIFLFSFLISNAQLGQWTWIHGSQTINDTGHMGIQGVPSQLNEPPSAYEGAAWKDNNGKFWMYSGLDYNTGLGIHNNLWKFDPVDSTWTWIAGSNTNNDPGNYGVKGVPSTSNFPPAVGYGTSTWTDLNGDLWLFGGNCNAYNYSDLWKYNIASNEWTWMKGPGTPGAPGVSGILGVPDTANYPSSRAECAANWVDKNGDLWIFGGLPTTNDMWRYSITTNTWTRMKGEDSPGAKGVWGTMGVEDAATVPSGRQVYCHWVDSEGNMWMYGGIGTDSAGWGASLSEMWRYNPCTNNWTWMNGWSGSVTAGNGNFGSKCISSIANHPPPKGENRACWTDPHGDFWMWGGSCSAGLPSDLWRYCASSNEWTFEGTSASFTTTANYGTEYVASPSNMPDGRMGSVGWIDDQWRLYLWGGSISGAAYCRNDLWRFAIDTTCGSTCAALVPAAAPAAQFLASDSVICTNACVDFTDFSTNNPTAWQWTFQGAQPDTSSLQNPATICYLNSGNFEVTLSVSKNGACNNYNSTITKYIYVQPAPATPTILQSGTKVPDSLRFIKNPGYASYQWYLNSNKINGATDTIYVAMQNGNYDVSVTDTNGCVISAGIIIDLIGVNEMKGYAPLVIYPDPVDKKLVIKNDEIRNGTLTICDMLGQTYIQSAISNPKSGIETDVSSLPAGVYFVVINATVANRWVGRFVKE